MPISNLSQLRLITCLSILSLWTATGTLWGQSKIEFNRDIRPILSQACFRCHGFDENTREADLRLDSSEAAFEHRTDGMAAISPNAPDESLVWQRIATDDSDLAMPPTSSNRQLTSEERHLIRRWIEEGAEYQDHWSFAPLPRESTSIDIDHELVTSMQERSLVPTDQADPTTRLRRLAFTLTGLPPDYEDVLAFNSDPSQENYERFVDQYLASPRFGEEMAKHWLDIARYGDTHGLHLDNERTIWAYRDWVVRAFNSNLPFDQFTIDQIAGDLHPNPTNDQWLATGFNRCNVTTGEGGAIDEEFLFRYAVDRTSTTVQTWLGLTAGCAVCHDHKYDPLSAKEFYSLYAFFYSAADPAMDGNVANTNPYRTFPSDDQNDAIAALRSAEQSQLETLLDISRDPVRRQASAKSTAKADTSANQKSVQSRVWFDDEMPLQSQHHNTSRNPEVWIHDTDSPMGKRHLFQSFGDRYEQTISGGWPVQRVPEGGKIQFWVKPDRLEPPKAISLFLKAGDKSRRWVWANSIEQAHLIDGGISETSGPMPTPGRWTLLTADLEGMPAESEVQEIRMALFGGSCSWDAITATGLLDESVDAQYETWWSANKHRSPAHMKEELRGPFKEGPESEAGKTVANDIEAYFYAFVAQNASDELLSARRAFNERRIDTKIQEAEVVGSLVFTDLQSPREAFVMERGQYDAPGAPVVPGTPAVLPPLGTPEGHRANRMDLARWLVAPENPLVARVAVNRLWQQVFGLGIVKTSDDFGTQGSPPTHPRILDELAVEFRQGGWDVKKMMKRLVSTAAFQRAARVDLEMRERDPDNAYLARGPRIRLDAEQIRDNILSVSRLLNTDMGGAGFKSYQPDNLWEPIGYGDSNTRYYIQDHGDSIYKRSLYAFIKRTAPPPFMSNFDAPNREQLCSLRGRSNTPLQALQLMNDLQYLEAARHFAEEIYLADKHQIDEQIDFLFERSLSRSPTESERQNLTAAHQSFLARLQAHPGDAAKIVRWGEKPFRPTGNDSEMAALTLLVNVVFNLDEFVNRN